MRLHTWRARRVTASHKHIDYNAFMTSQFVKLFTVGGAVVALLLAGNTAHAFRCKNKIVRDGMHEQQVVAICGAPTSQRRLGYASRGYDYGWRRVSPGGIERRHFPGGGTLIQEVVVTEYIYNFGPRRFIRRLVFEGGVLTSIESLGYGYVE